MKQDKLNPRYVRSSSRIVPVKKNKLPVDKVHDTALAKYIHDAFSYPVLTKEQEETLIKQMQNGDKEATKELIRANLKLVIRIAFEYKKNHRNIMDLIQEGTLGLIKAAQKYDPSKGARFSYYASWWVRSYILKYIIDNFRLVKIGTTQAQKRLFYNLINEQRKLENIGLKALPETLGKKLHVKEKDVKEMMSRLDAGAELSIDKPLENNDGSTQTFLDYYPDTSNNPEVLVEKLSNNNLLKAKLLNLMSTLNEKEREILKNRLLNDAPLTLQQIADKFSISKERVRQIEAGLLKKLRKELAEFTEA